MSAHFTNYDLSIESPPAAITLTKVNGASTEVPVSGLISPDIGNNLTVDANGFLYAPTGSSTITTDNSVTGDGSGGDPVELVNDENAPGNSQYYGTSPSGTKGWYALPAVGGETVTTLAYNASTGNVDYTNENLSTVNIDLISTNGNNLITFDATGHLATVQTQESITGTATSGSPLRLVNDEFAPGINQFYGTGPTGLRGWFPNVSSSNIITNDFDGADKPIQVGSRTHNLGGFNQTFNNVGTWTLADGSSDFQFREHQCQARMFNGLNTASLDLNVLSSQTNTRLGSFEIFGGSVYLELDATNNSGALTLFRPDLPGDPTAAFELSTGTVSFATGEPTTKIRTSGVNLGVVNANSVLTLTDETTGECEWVDAAAVNDTNLMENNLTQTANRTHDLAGFTHEWNNVGQFDLIQNSSQLSFDENATQIVNVDSGITTELILDTSGPISSILTQSPSWYTKFTAGDQHIEMRYQDDGLPGIPWVSFAAGESSTGTPTVFVRTADVDFGTAVSGSFLRLTDAATGECEWDTVTNNTTIAESTETTVYGGGDPVLAHQVVGLSIIKEDYADGELLSFSNAGGPITNVFVCDPNGEHIFNLATLSPGTWTPDATEGYTWICNNEMPAGVTIQPPTNMKLGEVFTLMFTSSQSNPPAFATGGGQFVTFEAKPTHAAETMYEIKRTSVGYGISGLDYNGAW